MNTEKISSMMAVKTQDVNHTKQIHLILANINITNKIMLILLVKKLESCKNYSSAFILKSNNLWTSAFKNNANSKMHLKACSLCMKSKSVPVANYVPI